MSKNKDEELKALREMTGDDSLVMINENDTFDFECQQCGKCCMHRNDIIINPFDVFKGAKHLGITCEEFIIKYTQPQFGNNSRIPMLLLASDKSTGFCPLLKFDIKGGGKFKCIIHEAKPGACWNHPIGILRASTKDEMENSNVEYIKVEQCNNSKGHNHLQTVKDWVKPSIDFAEELKYAHLIQTYVEQYFSARMFDFFIDAVIKSIDEEEEKTQTLKELREMACQVKLGFFTSFITIVYSHYDTNKSFVEQVKNNIKELDEFLNATKAILKTLYSIMPQELIDQVIKDSEDEHCFDCLKEEE